MLAIFAVSSIPDLGETPGGLPDYVWHFFAYAGLAALFVRAFAASDWSNVTAFAGWRAWTASVFYGASDEFHQQFVAGRHPSLDDWMADAAGAATAVVLLVVAAAGRDGDAPDSRPAD
jgi:VanZ family protein